jgi:predicted kinase
MNQHYLIIPIGIQGSGKSYYYEKRLKDKGVIRISKDEIRFKLINPKKNEKNYNEKLEPTIELFTRIELLLMLKINEKDIYLDSTNIIYSKRIELIELARKHNYKVKIIYFDFPLETCLKRNSKREWKVDEKIIEEYSNKMCPLHWNNEYDQFLLINKEF